MVFEPDKKTSLLDLLGRSVPKRKTVTSKKSEVPKKPNRSKALPKDSLGDEFLADLYEWMASGHPDIVKTRKPGLHASSLWQTCGRREIICADSNIEPVPRKFTAGHLQTTDEGHVLHQLWQDNYLANWGRLKGHWSCVACKYEMTDEIVSRPEHCSSCGEEEFRYEESCIEMTNGSIIPNCR